MGPFRGPDRPRVRRRRVFSGPERRLKIQKQESDGGTSMIGFSVQTIERRVSAEVVRKFRSLPVANVSDCMSRLTGGGPRLRPYHGEGTLSGPAFTVKTRPVDNLMVHKALD